MCVTINIAFLLCFAVTARGFNLGSTQIVFHLYTRQNPTISQPLLISQASLLSSGFDYNRRTVITIHNYGQSVASNFNAHVVSAYLAAEDLNVLAVDWSPGAAAYTPALANTPQVGERVAQFVNLLSNDFGYSAANVRIVGLGLGAHAAGIAAKTATGTIPHIIALDPSLPGWTHHSQKLSKDDAQIVEVIHTTAGHYGYDEPLGDLDFYPNGGSWQPACGIDISCSHSFSFIALAESIRADTDPNASRFVGTACESFEQAAKQECTSSRDAIFGGIAVKTTGSGIYWFQTRTSSPFALN